MNNFNTEKQTSKNQFTPQSQGAAASTAATAPTDEEAKLSEVMQYSTPSGPSFEGGETQEVSEFNPLPVHSEPSNST